MSLRNQVHVGLFHLAPVLTSGASLAWAFSEYQTLIPFLQSDIPAAPLASWFNRWFRLATAGIVGCGLASTSWGYVGSTRAAGMAGRLYLYGAVLSAAHFAFVPWIAPCIERLVYGPEHRTKDELRRWLRIHTVRTLLTDIPAFVCFTWGYLEWTS
ncbi:hypothetical protein CONPUDRAFT_82130 [Coniophora puteana RWD-64-598 SS2]|uniref:Integral membrane protein n=1 Tax=Coniophora puteana (strain RWD-64-598) TaxID=741705 RepID=A0A5M3MPF7_CONPW|nr:uncharacterized protein CONPUDRAFT_82130 [Coniophora puteana RWD-64-598 SS2]EIW81048.1 hypothetical protein CONPUDRAFT_82130 [Coniophora puteana RWD-64-598 SS2]